MTTRIVHFRVCDRCGKDATATRNFMWFGLRYEIDVCERHDDKLKGSLTEWTDKARVLTQTLSPTQLGAPPVEAPVIQLRPGPEVQWRHTAHSLQRCEERRIDPEEARRVAHRPAVASANRKDPTTEDRKRDGLLVVVNPATKEILTVVRPEEEALSASR